jgi:hypothetical protein
MQTLSYHRNIGNGWLNYPGTVKELHIYGQSAAKLLSSVVKHKMKNVHRLSREGVGKEIFRNGRNFYYACYICELRFTNMARRHQREYRIWKNMKARCYAPANSNLNYQLNNITVCDRWKDSYENFLADMGPCPKGYSIDRIDNSGNYCPENCRWADTATQAKNRGSFNMLYTYNKETKVLKDWARYFKIKYTTLYLRITRDQMSFEEAINFSDPRLIEYNGEIKTATEWSKIYNIPVMNIYDRKNKGWTIERIFNTPVKNNKN